MVDETYQAQPWYYSKYMLQFNNQFYGSGTKVLLDDLGTIKTAIFWDQLNHLDKPKFEAIGEHAGTYISETARVVQILEAVELPVGNAYLRELTQVDANIRGYPSKGEVQMGWVWYIVIMLLLTIFKDRIYGWCFTTLFFWMWLKTKK